MEAMKPQDR